MKVKNIMKKFDFYDELEYEEEYEDEEEYISSSESKFLREWQGIFKASEHNTALQHALERVKIIYHLSNEQ
jgi:hypothetical protein